MMSPKRSLSPGSDQSPHPKRLRTDSDDAMADKQHITTTTAEDEGSEGAVTAVASLLPTPHASARRGIQRSIALALNHDGFESTTPDVLENFTGIVETYLESMIRDIKTFALASRREHPTPIDFEATLRRYNLPISSLKPHIRHPVRPSYLHPKYVNAVPWADDAYTSLPLLGQELSGQADKDSKSYIPSAFPDFPSRHTYSFTPQDGANVRDAKKTREEAARTAQQGEEALRRLVRASKMREQKEVKSLVKRDVQGKERFRLWEATMKRVMGTDTHGEQQQPTRRVEIADHSMIVNGDAAFKRKEFSRQGQWSNVSRK